MTEHLQIRKIYTVQDFLDTVSPQNLDDLIGQFKAYLQQHTEKSRFSQSETIGIFNYTRPVTVLKAKEKQRYMEMAKNEMISGAVQIGNK